jgi:hypothetical protein
MKVLRQVARSRVADAFGILTIATFLAGCTAYVPGKQGYWDAKVKEMCERDGGVTLVAQVPITTSQLRSLGRVGDYPSIPLERFAKPSDPVFIRTHETVIRESNPRVTKWEETIVRHSDLQIVGRTVRYRRAGGDFPSPAEPSSFSCPPDPEIYAQSSKVYQLIGEGR